MVILFSKTKRHQQYLAWGLALPAMLKSLGHSSSPSRMYLFPLRHSDPTPTKHHFVVTLLLMLVTMTTMPHWGDGTMLLGNDAMLPCENLMPLGARSVSRTLHSSDDANLSNVATPFGTRLVTTTPRSGVDTPPLGDDTMPLGNNPTPFFANPHCLAHALQ